MLLLLLFVFIFAQDDETPLVDRFALSDCTTASKGMHLRGKKQLKFYKLGYCKAHTGGGFSMSEKYYMSGTKLYYEMWNGTTCAYPGVIWSKTFVDLGHNDPVVGDRVPTREFNKQLTGRVAAVTVADIKTEIGTDKTGVYFFDSKADCDSKDYSKVSYIDVGMIDPADLSLCTPDDGDNTKMAHYGGVSGHAAYAGFNISYEFIVYDGDDGYNYTTYVAESPYSSSTCDDPKNLKEGPHVLKKCDENNPYLPNSRSVTGINADMTTLPDGILIEFDEFNLYYNSLTAGTMYNATYDDRERKWEECHILVEQTSPAYASLVRCEPNTYTGKCNWGKCDYPAGNDGPTDFVETFPVDAAVDTCLTVDDDTWIYAEHNHQEEMDDMTKAYKLQFVEKPMKTCGGSEMHGHAKFWCNDTGVNEKGYYEVLVQRYEDDACSVTDGGVDKARGLFCVKDLAYPWRCDVCGGLTGCSTCVSKSKCTNCMSGYYLDGDTCTACPTGCTTCDSGTVCTACVATGYFKNGDSCDACSANCETCTSATVCTKCAATFELEAAKCVVGGDGSAAASWMLSLFAVLLIALVI